MKNNLFLTTAIAAATFVASNAMAEDITRNYSASDVSEKHSIVANTFGNNVNGNVSLKLLGTSSSPITITGTDWINGVYGNASLMGNAYASMRSSYYNETRANYSLVRKEDISDDNWTSLVSGDLNMQLDYVTVDYDVFGTFYKKLGTVDTSKEMGVKGKTTITLNNSYIKGDLRGGNGEGVELSDTDYLADKAKLGDIELNINNSHVEDEVVALGGYMSGNNVLINITGNSSVGYTGDTVKTSEDGWVIAGTQRNNSSVNNTEINLNTDGIIKIAGDVNVGSRERSGANNTDVNSVKGNATLNIFGGGNINVGKDLRAYHVAGNTALNINNATITVSGDVKEFKEINMDENAKLNIAGTLTLTSDSTVNMKLADTSNYSQIKVGTLDANNAALKFTFSKEGTYNIVDATTTTSAFSYDLNNTLYNITEDNGTLTVSQKSSAEVATETGASQNQAAAVTAITNGEGNNATFNAIAENISDLMQSGSAVGVQLALEAAETLAPEVAPVVLQTATENVGQIFSAVSARLSGGAATAPNSRGMASGDSVFENGAVWAQGLYNHSKLNDTRKAKGYKADSNGLAFGFEKQINENVKAGIGYAYTKTDVDGYNRDLDIDTHTALVYGEYKPSAWFVNAMASYSWSDYDEDKRVLGQKITGDYDAQSYALQAMSGYEFAYDNTIFTPEAGLRYIHISQDGHKDTAGQYVYGSEVDTLTGIAGLRVEQAYALDNGWTLRPSARFAVTYDIANDDGNSAALLANGTAYSVKGEAMDRFGMEADFALTADISENASVSLGYQGKFRDDYKDHTGLLNLKYNF